MKLKNILIIDGSFALHRGLKVDHIFNMRNSELKRTGGIYSFINILQKELKLANNYYPIVCWDDGQSDRRLSIYDNYKKHREKLEDPDRKPFNKMTDEELDEDYVYNYKLQRKYIIELLNSFGIPSLLFRHTEGDDLMYWLANHCEKCRVLTDDKDLLQLLSKNCTVRQPMRDRIITLQTFLKENNYESINDFIRQKALLGDASDNIPSACYKVGEKTSLDFFKVYDSLKENNLIDKINDENYLKNYCKEHDLKFKKSYCNFDENQYLNNLELVDLHKIHDDEFDDAAIYENIKKVYKNKDVTIPMKLLDKYEIRTVNTNIIFESLMINRYNIKEN